MIRLYFDTETTGKLAKKWEPIDKQPRIVQIAAMLTNPDFEPLASVNLIVKRDGFDIPDEAAKIHGITNEISDRYGIPLRHALATFSQLARVADELVAHNFDYDSKVYAYECGRMNVTNVIPEKAWFCTMLATKDILKLPGLYGDYKFPKLEESYRYFFNEMFDGAHDAFADMKGCARIQQRVIADWLAEDALKGPPPGSGLAPPADPQGQMNLESPPPTS